MLDARHRVCFYIPVAISKGEDRFQVCHAGVNRGRCPPFLFYIHLPAREVAATEKLDAQVEEVLMHNRPDVLSVADDIQRHPDSAFCRDVRVTQSQKVRDDVCPRRISG